ncbi:glycoside hydrolase family 65 protein [Phytohabitans aurantiacus]|jgi:alpha,alpha-trehalose phosphorylase|uniref:Glycosyl hydrolase n=1 Tax=Phytohabitans aurantiacus TaxID=3016789 RepID=A0ABQ5QUQ6_9ACTN|nr:glycoside hydrolase family 65 protein [Phytohabitans aurantiacus]GLH98323.1 glycosyl hydrolase [Phytohabitans aurantiacus]
MIRERAYPVEPWHVRETRLDLDVLAQSESVFALSNGHIGLRGNLDEGEPHGLPGTYLNSFYELRPLPYAEAGYGFPESGQTVVNVTNGKLIRLLVDDEPFDLRYGEVRTHQRVLDMQAGTLDRTVEWVSPAGRAVRVHSTRLVSFTQRAIAAICYEVEAADDKPLRLILQSELVANEELPATRKDPRVAAVLKAPLKAEEHLSNGSSGLLIHRTKKSGLRMAAAMDHVVDGAEKVSVSTEAYPDWARTTVACLLQPGEKLRVVKLLAYGWSSRRSLPALRDQVGAAIASARFSGWDGLRREQRKFLDAFWDAADVRLEGDPEVQQAVRFGLFHVLQAGARAEQRPIAAKGLTGPGYDGHVFWDTETFVLPVLTYTQPEAVKHGLRWRHATLDLARERARTLGLKGAAFPWRTVRGHECSGYWPAGTAGFHIGADIADAVIRYVTATGDYDFEREVGLEILVDTARLWRSLGHHDRHGIFHIDGVTGPDEYTAVVNDNVYTNLMARWNLLGAADAAVRHPDQARRLGVDEEESASWRDAAAAMHIPYDEELGVHQQCEGFTRLQEWDFAATPPTAYPLLLNYPYFDLYRKQVLKQSDLVLAMHWRGDAFTPEQKARNFAYYEARTVRDSSLSVCTQAVLAAEVGHMELAHDYLGEAALMDLHDIHNNTREGLHMAALAGAWIAVVCGLGGMRDHGGALSFAPRLPSRISKLEFSLLWRGLRVRVDVDRDEVTYSLRDGHDGAELELLHHGEAITVTADKPVIMSVPPLPPVGPSPRQPWGRAPARRMPEKTS